MRYKLISSKKQLSFKNRNNKKRKVFKFIFGNNIVVSFKNCNIDFIHFSMFKKLIKKLYKIKYYKIKSKKI
jgi:hypothetical protein